MIYTGQIVWTPYGVGLVVRAQGRWITVALDEYAATVIVPQELCEPQASVPIGN